MRVAIVHSFYRSAVSGENRAVRLQVQALRDAGLEVALFELDSQALSETPGYELAAGLTVATGRGRSPLRDINEFQPDLIHVHNLFPNWSHKWLSRTTAPVVTTIHNFRSLCPAATLSRNGKFCDLCPTSNVLASLQHRCYQGSVWKTVPVAIYAHNPANNPLLTHSSRLIFPGHRAAETFFSYAQFVDKEKVRILPNFSPGAKHPIEETGGQNWLYAGRISKEKGVDQLLDHWPVGIPLHVYGAGPLETLLQRRSGEDIAFLGHYSYAEIERVFSSARGVVFPSVTVEAAPAMVYVEALARGLPVISSPHNTVADDVELSQSGVVLDSWEDLPRAISRIDQDYHLFSANAIRRHTEEFSESTWVSRIVAIYQGLLT